MIELGVISEVNGSKAKAAINGMVTDSLPVFAGLANSYATSFAPLRVGEQVLVLGIKNDLNSGVILRGLYQNAYNAPTVDDKTLMIKFEDGAVMSYNSASHTLEIKSLNKITIKANSTIDIDAPNLNLKGNLNVSGVIKDAKGDLTNHSHSDSDGATSLPR